MSRLPSVTPAQMVRILKRADFVEDHQKGSHLFLWHASKRVMTPVPMHGKTLKRWLQMKIIKQTGISQDEFANL